MPRDITRVSCLVGSLVMACVSWSYAENPHPVTQQRPTDGRVPDWTDATVVKTRLPRRATQDQPPAPVRLASARQLSSVTSVAPPETYYSATPDPIISATGARCDACAYGRYLGPELGTSLQLHFGAQVNLGRKAEQVLYHFDFENRRGVDLIQLNRFGRIKLRRLASLMETTGAPLIIEHVPGNLALSEARRAHVLETVQTQLGVPLSPEQVVIGLAPVPGLRGVEADEVHRNQLSTTRSQGTAYSGFQSGLTNNLSTGTGISR